MPGFRLASQVKLMSTNVTGKYPVGISQTEYEGDIAVLTKNTTVAQLSSVTMPSVRSLLAADITASYQDGSGNICGILGIAQANFKSDANAQATGTAVNPTNISSQVILAAPSVASVNPQESTQGRSLVTVYTADPQENRFYGQLWQNTTVNASLVGTQVGIKISTLTNQAAYFFLDSAASVKIAVITRVDETDPLFNQTVSANVANTTHNPRAWVEVQFLPAYVQELTGFQYSAQ